MLFLVPPAGFTASLAAIAESEIRMLMSVLTQKWKKSEWKYVCV